MILKLGATLFPISRRKLHSRTFVHSNQNRIQGDLGLNHETVNHSVNFVDPTTGVQIQNAESNWSAAKKNLKKIKGN